MPFCCETDFFRDSVEKCLFLSFVHENSIFWDHNRNSFYVLCIGVGQGKRNPEGQATPLQTLCRRGSSGANSPTWSSRFDIATHSQAPGPLHCCLLSSLFSFLLQCCRFTTHSKLSQLEFSTVLLGCHYTLANLL